MDTPKGQENEGANAAGLGTSDGDADAAGSAVAEATEENEYSSSACLSGMYRRVLDNEAKLAAGDVPNKSVRNER